MCRSQWCGMRHHRSVLVTLSNVWVVHQLDLAWIAEVQNSFLCWTGGPQAHAVGRCGEWAIAIALAGVGTHTSIASQLHRLQSWALKKCDRCSAIASVASWAPGLKLSDGGRHARAQNSITIRCMGGTIIGRYISLTASQPHIVIQGIIDRS